MDNGAQEMGLTPYSGTIQDLTFNLFSILLIRTCQPTPYFGYQSGKQPWAVVQGPRTQVRGPRALGLGSRIGATGAGWWIWSELVRGGGVCWGGAARTSGGWWISKKAIEILILEEKIRISCLITQVWSGVLKYHNATIGLNFNRMLW